MKNNERCTVHCLAAVNGMMCEHASAGVTVKECVLPADLGVNLSLLAAHTASNL